MGVVYEAEDTRLERVVALKFLPPHLTHDSDRRKRLVREAQAAATIDHPNVCTIYEIDETDDGQLFICMAYCPGETLLSRIRRGPLEPSEALRIALLVGQGLARAHDEGIIHRDIKPANIMITERGEVKILDFGVAKLTDRTSLTGTGTVAGTLAYMPPELVEGRPVDHRMDIWSLGVILYEMLTGRLPFWAESAGALLHAICNKKPRPLPEVSDLPPGLPEIIDRCLAKDPVDRDQSMVDLLRDIATVHATILGAEKSTSKLHRSHKRSRWAVWAAGAAGVVLAAWAVAVWRDIRPDGVGRHDEIDTKALAVLGFDNLADPDDTDRLGQILQELVITDLSEVSSLRVLSSQRLFDLQKQLGYTRRARIGEEVAAEVARRAGASLMLDGAIMQIEGKWTLTCRLIDVNSGEIVQSQRIDGTDVHGMVDSLSGQIREDLGLPLGTADAIDVAVREKTSTSMEAYRHYLAGMDLLYASGLARAIAEFQSAVEIDPTFNQAYYWMAIAQWWSDDISTQLGRASIARILDSKRYTTERERLLAEGALAMIDRRFTDAVAIHKDLAGRFPDSKEIHFALGLAYLSESSMNRDEALSAFQRAINLDLAFVLPYREVANIYLSEREYPKVEEMASALITIRPESPMGYRYMLEAAIGKGDAAQIELALQQALLHHETPEDLQALYYHMGLACNRVGDEVNSELYTRKALAYNPETTDYRIFAQLGDALFNQGKHDEARAVWQRGLELNPLSSWCLGGLWYVAMADRDYDRAVEHARKLVEMRPQEPRRHGELVSSLVNACRMMDADAAIEAGVNAIPSPDGKVDLLLRAAAIYKASFHLDRAEALLRRADALDASSDSPSVYAELASIANLRREYDSAGRYADRALAVEPDHEEALSERSFSYLYSGKAEQAIDTARRRIENRPSTARSYTSLIEAYVVSARHAEADSVLEHACEVDVLPLDRHRLLTDCAGYYRRAGKYRRAEELYRRALALIPGNLRVRSELAALYESMSRYDAARREYETVLETAPRDLGALRGMGRLHLRQRNYKESERWYRTALQIDDGHPQTLRELGYLFSERGQYAEARRYAEQALERDPTSLSRALLGWILVVGDLDLAAGADLARRAAREPPPNDPTNEWVSALPFAPLPQYTLGLAHIKEQDFRAALPFLEIAAELRPHDRRIANDLQTVRETFGR